MRLVTCTFSIRVAMCWCSRLIWLQSGLVVEIRRLWALRWRCAWYSCLPDSYSDYIRVAGSLECFLAESNRCIKLILRIRESLVGLWLEACILSLFSSSTPWRYTIGTLFLDLLRCPVRSINAGGGDFVLNFGHIPLCEYLLRIRPAYTDLFLLISCH